MEFFGPRTRIGIKPPLLIPDLYSREALSTKACWLTWLFERPRSHRRLFRSNCRARRTTTPVGFLIGTNDDQLREDKHRLRLKCQIHATVFVWSRLELKCRWTNSDINDDSLR
jgi:hypothetical protein